MVRLMTTSMSYSRYLRIATPKLAGMMTLNPSRPATFWTIPLGSNPAMLATLARTLPRMAAVEP